LLRIIDTRVIDRDAITPSIGGARDAFNVVSCCRERYG